MFLDSFLGVFWTVTFFANLLLNVNILLTRKFRSSRGSETRRKLDSVKCFVGAGLWTLYFSGKSAAEYAENLLERN